MYTRDVGRQSQNQWGRECRESASCGQDACCKRVLDAADGPAMKTPLTTRKGLRDVTNSVYREQNLSATASVRRPSKLSRVYVEDEDVPEPECACPCFLQTRRPNCMTVPEYPYASEIWGHSSRLWLGSDSPPQFAKMAQSWPAGPSSVEGIWQDIDAVHCQARGGGEAAAGWWIKWLDTLGVDDRPVQWASEAQPAESIDTFFDDVPLEVEFVGDKPSDE